MQAIFREDHREAPGRTGAVNLPRAMNTDARARRIARLQAECEVSIDAVLLLALGCVLIVLGLP